MAGNFIGSSFIGSSVTASTELRADTINEVSSTAGVTIDGVLIKDGEVDGRDVEADGKQIETNKSNITTNAGNIASNASDISTNQAAIATNTGNISTNASNISTNETNIATNAGNIAANSSDISTNAVDIATNASEIVDKTDGPASSTDKHIARFDGASGKILQDSKVEITDDGDLIPDTTKSQALGSGTKTWEKLYLEEGSSNVLIGNNTSWPSLAGSENVLVGRSAGAAISSGLNNTVFGSIAGQSISTGSHNTIIGRGANVTTGSHSNQIALGYSATCDASNQCTIGNGSLTVIRPGADDTCDLGSSARQFKDIYVSSKVIGPEVGYYLEINQSSGSTGTKTLSTTDTELKTPQFSITVDDYEKEVVHIQGAFRFQSSGAKRYITVRLKRDSDTLVTLASGIGYFESKQTYLEIPFSYYDTVSANDTYTYKFAVASSSGTPAPILELQHSFVSVSRMYVGNHNIVTETWS